MKYVTVKRDVSQGESGKIVRIYRELRFEAKEVLGMASLTLLIMAIVFICGMCAGVAKIERAMTEQTEVVETEETEEIEIYSPSVPLSLEEQQDLYEATAEFGVDYYTMLGLIEKETDFRNVTGDGGNASGYCQIWEVYWNDLMRDIGAEGLNAPRDNFRTACAIMRQLTDRYGSTAGALTAYNTGDYDGTVTEYATDVLENAEKWRGI